jgi:hypothetical protein
MSMTDRIAASVTDVRTHIQRLVQLNIELVKAEVAQRGRLFAAAVGLLVAAAVLALYALGFLLATITVALSLVLPLWLSLLIVTAVLFILVAIMILVGKGRFEKAQSPAAQKAIASAQETAQQLGQHLGRTARAADPRGKGASAPDVGTPASTKPSPPAAPVGSGTAEGSPSGRPPLEGERS